MKIQHFACAVLLIFSSLAFAGLPEVEAACTPEKLNGLFFSTAPQFMGVNWILSLLIDKPQEYSKCLELLNTDQKLRAELNKGREARAEYLQFYRNHFETTGDRNLVLTPDLEILRRIYAQIDSGKKKSGEVPAKDWEIRERALSDTKSRFALPSGMQAQELERLGRGDSRYYHAFDYYRRLETRLRLSMVSKGPATVQTPDQFKAMMVEKLVKLRVQNLKAAISDGQAEWKNNSFEFEDLSTHQSTKLRVEELLTADIQLIPTEISADSKIQRSLPVRVSHFINRYIHFWGIDTRNSYYSAIFAEESLRHDNLRITTQSGQTVLVNNTDFVELLNTLGPKKAYEHYDRAPLLHRFRLEASARDAQLANEINFINGVRDHTFEDLYKRYRAKVDQRTFDPGEATPFLTYEMNIAGETSLENSPRSDLLWFGWRYSPSFWDDRNREARSRSLPNITSTQELSGKAKRKMNKAIRKGTKIANYRMSSTSDRAKTIVKRSIRNTAIATAMMSAAIIAPSVPDLINVQLPQFMSNGIQWDFLGRAGGGDTMDPDQAIEADNYLIPKNNQDGDGKGKDKTVKDAHDPGSSPYQIEVLFKNGNIPPPTYYNFANSVHKNKSYLSYLFMDTSKPYELAIDVNIRNRANKRNEVGLTQMTDYTLVNLEMYDWKNQKVLASNYEVYFNSENRQTFARVDNTSSGPFTFRAYYAYTPQLYRPGKLNAGIPASSVANVNASLERSGFTDVSKEINHTLALNAGAIGYTYLAENLARSSTYIYTNKTWWPNRSADAVFAPYTKFLNNGHLYIQCTGSNLLFQTVLNETLKQSANEIQAKAIPLVGLAFGGEKGIPRKVPGHLHTLMVAEEAVRTTFGVSYQHDYLELDATPSGSAPQDFQEAVKIAHPTKPERPQFPPGILPTAPTEIPGGALEEKTANLKTFFDPLKPDEIKRILERLHAMREAAKDSLEPVFKDSSWVRKQDFSEIPGARLVVLTRLLLSGFQEHQSVELLLAHLHNPKLHTPSTANTTSAQAANELNRIFKDELAAYRKSIDGIEMRVQSGQPSQMDFLLHDPVRSRMRELAEVLAAYSWGDLLQVNNLAPTLPQPSSCEQALSGHSK